MTFTNRGLFKSDDLKIDRIFDARYNQVMMNVSPHLRGKSIDLHLYDEAQHRVPLTAAAQSTALWTYQQPHDMPLNEFVNQYIDALNAAHQSGEALAYVVFDAITGQIIGSTRYYECSITDKKCCIGFTWLIPERWGTGVNEASKYLLLSQIFEDFMWHRVGFHVDSRNQRSLGALSKLGAVREGLLRQHKIVQGGVVRDTVQWSIVKDEWPAIKRRLEMVLRPV